MSAKKKPTAPKHMRMGNSGAYVPKVLDELKDMVQRGCLDGDLMIMVRKVAKYSETATMDRPYTLSDLALKDLEEPVEELREHVHELLLLHPDADALHEIAEIASCTEALRGNLQELRDVATPKTTESEAAE